MKRIFLAIILILLISGCSSSNTSQEQKVIKIGATAGPYSDQVSEGIKPILEEKGYEVEVVEYTDYIQPNLSLDQKDIDANVFQNSLYMKDFAETRGLDINEAVKVPTAPIAIYSEKHRSIDDVEDGHTVATSNDPVNQARLWRCLRN